MSLPLLDTPITKEAKRPPITPVNVILSLQFILHSYTLLQFLQAEWSFLNLIWAILLIALPLLVLYFILPVFLLALVQIILYSASTAVFLEEGKGWSLRLQQWQHFFSYGVVLIGCQLIISYFALSYLIQSA